ncbi:Murein L,D-transpeptidase YcbB/YkuD [Cyclobacterium lianum]|uniref:Murein L,D-transpeptidase YcbB/YkuD n=1 Tax=Cyclobacterium lianum TaxID=388280 RepID=A0A1M7QD30_9BACT|nr:L,D-transpeptidase family protein [Cyclobacterium lianum]SHN28666.1 Murein L,D-transpeptidase YcbB/YkuD [Cyclobacterium lianum]
MKVYFRQISLILTLIFTWLQPGLEAEASLPTQNLPGEIRSLLESDPSVLDTDFQQNSLFSRSYLLTFYSDRAFAPAWLTGTKPSCEALELRLLIQQSRFDGLLPEDYHLGQLDLLFEKALANDFISLREQALMEVLLSDAFILLARHLYQGKVHPEHLEGVWDIQHKENEPKVLEKLNLALSHKNVRQQLFSLHPKFGIYHRMRQTIKKYYELEKALTGPVRKIAVPDKPLEPGHRAAQIAELRQRLIFWKDLDHYAPDSGQADVYDSLMVEGVKNFQSRHGLLPDGRLGKATVAALNHAPKDLIEKAAVNMERLRWLPDTTLQEFVLVNIANFSMDFIRQKDTLLHSNAIVGQSYRKTPVFNAEMSYLVFSPTWTVPPTILANDVIPAVRKDISYLRNKNMRLLDFSGNEIDPVTVNWGEMTGRNFPYMIRQSPGPHNSLGLVKFMFPNKYNVYMHDTPSRDLFFRADRALSSGCIRIQKPFELAQLLLADQPLWNDERIRNAMNSGREQTVTLKRKIPVVLIYLTFWTDASGQENIRKDIYSRDAELLKLLQSPLAKEN